MTAQIEPFHAIAVSTLAHRLSAEAAKAGRPVIHMEFGQPSTSAPAAAIARAHHVLDTQAQGYWESAALKERIARHYHESAGVAVDPAQVVLTCGASPALVMALTLRFAPARGWQSPGPAMSPIATRCARCTWSRWNWSAGRRNASTSPPPRLPRWSRRPTG
jgi:aspartate/methionine/tyrosine aminotransferase